MCLTEPQRRPASTATPYTATQGVDNHPCNEEEAKQVLVNTEEEDETVGRTKNLGESKLVWEDIKQRPYPQ